ncbi:capsular biosynthesis protein [Glutamicibacter soli]|uniref:Capsular biosynthesis protein n=2 Tax=Glutamicibacter soli TaxID=453836 RepID=A0A6L9G6U1_9MICC|nr:stealth family protein [Glutamicibacter soli]NAZ17481.1 capsular biosynthesis protein [Glutamicibacter soli]
MPKSVYGKVRVAGLHAQKSVRKVRQRVLLELGRDYRAGYSCDVVQSNGMAWKLGGQEMPADRARRNFQLVTNALDAAAIEWWFVGKSNYQAAFIAVNAADRVQVRAALTRVELGEPLYARSGTHGTVLPASSLSSERLWEKEDVISVFTPQRFRNSTLVYGAERGCRIEFWEFGQGEQTGQVIAPRENRAARLLSAADVKLVQIETAFGSVPTPVVLTERMVDDITFPIDAVYTWVDGDDPTWINSKRRREAELSGAEYHEEANHEARFRSRDELKYSLRSLQMFAPWFRKIFIVTAGQVPNWLDTSDPRIEIVDHKSIYPEGDCLPTFNSNSIISRLHHIPGLSEHYVYINDDVFFGRDLGPERFFTPTGIAKVSPSNNRRPFGEATLLDEPHFNLTRNIRRLLKERFGVTVSRAIKHTPHPQLKSVHFEMEADFRQEYEQTWASPFRDHRDIVADQLHHYYAQIIGRAIPTRLRYHYINILDDKYRLTMENTLRLRDRDTFCINDAPVAGATPIDDDFVTDFLESYFPVKSDFEK